MFVMQHVGLNVDHSYLMFHEILIKNKKVMSERIFQTLAPIDP